MSGSHRVVAWTAALWLLAGSAGGEERPAAEAPPPAGKAAIEAALDRPTQIEFVESPLSDVVDFLKDYHGIEIQLDQRALGEAGVATDAPITKNLKNLSLRSALNLTLRDLHLAWTLRDEVLLVTTPEQAAANLTTRVYDVFDLVACYDKDDEPWDDYDTLVYQIRATVEPTTWRCVGGPASIAGASLGTARVLIVRQTPEAHREIAMLLESIREIGRRNPDADWPQRDRPQVKP